MKIFSVNEFYFGAILVLLLFGCSPSPSPDEMVPPISDENCTTQKIGNIKDKASREAFANACFKRGAFKPSPPRSW